MPRINPTVTEEARKIYDSWKDDKKANTSMAIIMFEEWRQNGCNPFTQSQLEYLEKNYIRKEGK